MHIFFLISFEDALFSILSPKIFFIRDFKISRGQDAKNIISSSSLLSVSLSKNETEKNNLKWEYETIIQLVLLQKSVFYPDYRQNLIRREKIIEINLKMVLLLQNILSYYNITFPLMLNQQSEIVTKIYQVFNSILNSAVLSQIEQQAQQKLINLSKKPNCFFILLELIRISLKENQEVIIRLKVLCILQKLISNEDLEENMENMNSIISSHERRVKTSRQGVTDLSDMNNYLHVNVQLSYLTFLRKMICWQTREISADGLNQIDLGFILINKIRDIIQLKKLFHNYGCYFPTHLYAVSMFKMTLMNIKKIWNQICYMVKEITIQAIKTNMVASEEYLFICSVEEIQDLLMEFVYGGYFSAKIKKEQKIKYITLLKPEIKRLHAERNKKRSSQKVMEDLMVKRQSRKLEAQLEKQNEKQTGCSSESIQQKLNTQMELEILDSILRLESLLNQ